MIYLESIIEYLCIIVVPFVLMMYYAIIAPLIFQEKIVLTVVSAIFQMVLQIICDFGCFGYVTITPLSRILIPNFLEF